MQMSSSICWHVPGFALQITVIWSSTTPPPSYGLRSFCISAPSLWKELLSQLPADDIVVNNSHEGWTLQLFVRAYLFIWVPSA